MLRFDRKQQNSVKQLSFKNKLIKKRKYLGALYAEYIIRNVGLGEAQAGIKIARRNINNLRYMDDITLLAES